MEFKDYYNVLGLGRDATQDEIKRAYRKLARKYHPDVNTDPDADKRFKDAGEAYEVLKDPEKRAAYDQLGANWQAGQDFQRPPDWDSGFEFSGGGYTEADQSRFSNFFSDLFGRGRTSAFDQRDFFTPAQEQHAKIPINLRDAYKGVGQDLILRVPEVGADGHVSITERKVRVNIPKGVTQGQHLRLPGQSGQGDLFLEIDFHPDPMFRVDSKDVYLDLPVTPWEAALGAKVRMPTPIGVVDISIPKGARSGQKLRLKGRGIPAKTPGHLYAVLNVVVPPAESKTSRELYAQLSSEQDFNPRSELGV